MRHLKIQGIVAPYPATVRLRTMIVRDLGGLRLEISQPGTAAR